MMNSREKALLAILIAALIGGLTSPLTKLGIREIPPVSFAFIRFLISSVIILPFFLRHKQNLKKDLTKIVSVSLLASVNILLFVKGIKTTTAIISQLLYAGVPLLTLFFSSLILKTHLKLTQVIGVIIGFIGVGLIVLLPIIQKGENFSGDLNGNLMILFGVIVFSLYGVLSKRLQSLFYPITLTSLFIFTTTIFLAPFFIYDLFTSNVWWLTVGWGAWLSILYIVVFSTVLSYFLYQYAIKHGNPTIASLQLYIQPVAAFIASSILLGEQLTLVLILGGTIALVGVYFTTKE